MARLDPSITSQLQPHSPPPAQQPGPLQSLAWCSHGPAQSSCWFAVSLMVKSRVASLTLFTPLPLSAKPTFLSISLRTASGPLCGLFPGPECSSPHIQLLPSPPSSIHSTPPFQECPCPDLSPLLLPFCLPTPRLIALPSILPPLHMICIAYS